MRVEVLTEIEDIACSKNNMRIIVTSRPQQSMKASNYFTVVTLDNLKGKEYAQVIGRLTAGQMWSKSLVDHIEKRAKHIKPLLCTPLMVTLLVLLYKSYQHLPGKLSEFYDALFQTLLQRHDGTKPGFTRQRSCQLDDTQYRNAFEAICILAKKKPKKTYTTSDLYGITKEALCHCGLDANPSKYIDDIVKITCLILREGEEHRFIHKTVQEYHTACFVRNKPDPWTKKFYATLLDSNVYEQWRQELAFLSEIDTYRYRKHFLLPAYLEELGITEKQLIGKRPVATAMRAKAILGGILIHFCSPRGSIEWVHGRQSIFDSLYFFARVINEIRDNLEQAINDGSINSYTGEALKQRAKLVDSEPRLLSHISEWEGVVTLQDLLDDSRFKPIILSAIDAHMKALFSQAQNIAQSLKDVESTSILDGLI